MTDPYVLSDASPRVYGMAVARQHTYQSLFGDNMNLVRLGHYFTPVVTEGDLEAGIDFAGTCRTALVIHVWSDEMVNLVVWNTNGSQENWSSVPVEAPSVRQKSFHLSGDCPWHR